MSPVRLIPESISLAEPWQSRRGLELRETLRCRGELEQRKLSECDPMQPRRT